ncbi:MAG: tyrosine-type recombinase/integrase [Casimicrobiaceae bacterium]
MRPLTLRHTWASWHVQAGTLLQVLQELGSWECVEMVRKYAHVASDRLVQCADRMSGPRLVQDGKVATFSAAGTQ